MCGLGSGTNVVAFGACCFDNESKSYLSNGFFKLMSGNMKPSSSDLGERFLYEMAQYFIRLKSIQCGCMTNRKIMNRQKPVSYFKSRFGVESSASKYSSESSESFDACIFSVVFFFSSSLCCCRRFALQHNYRSLNCELILFGMKNYNQNQKSTEKNEKQKREKKTEISNQKKKKDNLFTSVHFFLSRSQLFNVVLFTVQRDFCYIGSISIIETLLTKTDTVTQSEKQ